MSPDVPNGELERLAQRSRELAERIKESPWDRPFFIEFAGSPKSGKSTTISVVEHFLRRTGFAVLAPTEGASQRTPRYLRDDLFSFNVWSAMYALRHVIEGQYHPDQHRISTLDRGLFDALAWFQFLAQRGAIEPDDKDAVQRFLTIGHWRSVVDLVFLFTTDPAISMAREHSETLIQKPGRAMNPEVLTQLNDAYKIVRADFAPLFNDVRDVATGNDTTPQSTAFEVVTKILESIGARTE